MRPLSRSGGRNSSHHMADFKTGPSPIRASPAIEAGQLLVSSRTYPQCNSSNRTLMAKAHRKTRTGTALFSLMDSTRVQVAGCQPLRNVVDSSIWNLFPEVCDCHSSLQHRFQTSAPSPPSQSRARHRPMPMRYQHPSTIHSPRSSSSNRQPTSRSTPIRSSTPQPPPAKNAGLAAQLSVTPTMSTALAASGSSTTIVRLPPTSRHANPTLVSRLRTDRD